VIAGYLKIIKQAVVFSVGASGGKYRAFMCLFFKWLSRTSYTVT
jgi:hypothetical protein